MRLIKTCLEHRSEFSDTNKLIGALITRYPRDQVWNDVFAAVPELKQSGKGNSSLVVSWLRLNRDNSALFPMGAVLCRDVSILEECFLWLINGGLQSEYFDMALRELLLSARFVGTTFVTSVAQVAREWILEHLDRKFAASMVSNLVLCTHSKRDADLAWQCFKAQPRNDYRTELS